MWLEQLQSLPTTFPKMLFALTSLQREVLELDALYEYITVYKEQIASYVPGSAPSVVQTVGAFTSSPGVAQQLWSAGIPFWLLRPTHVFDAETFWRSLKRVLGKQTKMLYNAKTTSRMLHWLSLIRRMATPTNNY
ncbi:hypothetical protein C8F04DRAFT_1299199 [Mycena alexandri]|uniref:Uncharacterized protein n=1 Tax=Mycena alexandri TaxID=1745969 RepID=A0AAD6T8D6_9AGAR|nr:hypothetical protein C8F04DRAFT_1299199 [Mycena alexandri]